jgi:hypothetical protein
MFGDIRLCESGYTYTAPHVQPESNEVFSTEAGAQKAYWRIVEIMEVIKRETPNRKRYEELCATYGVQPKTQFDYGDSHFDISAYEQGERAIELIIHRRRVIAMEQEVQADKEAAKAATNARLAAHAKAIQEEEDLDGPTGHGW